MFKKQWNNGSKMVKENTTSMIFFLHNFNFNSNFIFQKIIQGVLL